MAVPLIYFLLILAYGLFVISLITKNPTLAILSAFLMFPLSIYIFVNGMDIFAHDNILVRMTAAVTFAIACYTSFQATYELYNN